MTALRAGEETDLEHGSGVGLWLIDWVIDNSSATTDYETDKSGTTVTVTVPRRDWPVAGCASGARPAEIRARRYMMSY